MKKLGWYCGVAIIVFLAGCQGYRPDMGGERKFPPLASLKKQECHAAACPVDVDVSCESSVCSALVDPKVLLINGGHDNQIIMWTLNDDGAFEFPDDGVSQPSGFMCEKQSAKKFKCTDPHYVKGVFTYTVKVRRTSTGEVVVADPWIVNN